MLYINLRDYLQIENALTKDLRLKQYNAYACKNENSNTLYYIFIQVDANWVKLARSSLKRLGLFTVLKTNKQPKLKTTKQLNYKIVIKL